MPSTVSKPDTHVQAFMGGFVFTIDKIQQLCIDAFHIPVEEVDKKGPFAMAQDFYDYYSAIDSPNFVPTKVASKTTPACIQRVYLLVCRIAYVSPGEPVPGLPFDERTERYMERWFPRRVRDSPPFEGIEYVEVPYPRDIRRELPLTVGSCDFH